MKRILAALLALAASALCAGALAEGALSVGVSVLEQGENRVALFYASAPGSENTNDAADTDKSDKASDAKGAAATDGEDARAAAAGALIEARFEQTRAATVYSQALARGGDRIRQRESLWQDGRIASQGLVWQGERPSGPDGGAAYGLALDLVTGEELTFSDLFADADAAASAMEAIIEADIVSELSDYLEFAELLPMPRDCFWFDADGFTVGYPSERYRYFDGECGTVHFAWHELAEYIGEDSPLYALSRPQAADAAAVLADAEAGRLGAMPYAVGQRLGDALDALTLLADPDYTKDSMVYLFEESALRGYALEIPLYADTAEEDTPISAVRASRASFHGLTTGETARAEIVALLGEPDDTAVYDADDARDFMLEPGESLIYLLGGRALEAHLDEGGVLSCLILRDGPGERP